MFILFCQFRDKQWPLVIIHRQMQFDIKNLIKTQCDASQFDIENLIKTQCDIAQKVVDV